MSTTLEARPEELQALNLPIEQQLQGGALDINAASHLPENDPVQDALMHSGVHGNAVAELTIGGQHFAVVDIGDAPRQGDFYDPFEQTGVLTANSPQHFGYGEGKPLMLLHFDDTGKLTGRALRPGEPVFLGRNAHQMDPKSSRFNYGHDSYMSRDHASIQVDRDGILRITDRNSANGSTVRYKAENPYEVKAIDPEKTIPEERIESSAEDDNQAALTHEMLMHPEFFPRQEIIVGDKTFYLSDIIKSNREFAVMYSTAEIDGKQVTVPRMLYKSMSDGGWRVAFGVEPDGRFIKESRHESHYTQETKLHGLILEALEKANQVPDSDHAVHRKILQMFASDSDSFDQLNTGKKEIEYIHEPQIDKHMARAREYTAGMLSAAYGDELKDQGYGSFTEWVGQINDDLDKIPGFIPDFSGLPEKVTHQKHTLLGDITIEDYHAVAGSKPIVWSIAKDGNGRVWIENIRPSNSRVTSYGTYDKIIDGGLLTSKPVDYIAQTEGLHGSGEVKPFDLTYNDITPLLKNLLPIKEYLKAKKLS